MSNGSVTVWNENVHEQENDAVAEIYPEGIHGAIASGLADRGFATQTAKLQEPEHGLTESVLDDTDVLVWWSHIAQDEVDDVVAERVQERVRDGMGFVPLHSAHISKPFKALMGTSCWLKWREGDERERIWAVEPGHPIAAGVEDCIELDAAETYGERFDIPQPDELVFISWFEGGEVFRSGCCYRRGDGRIFYFRPGHETYPIYHNDEILDVLANAVAWAAPVENPGSSRQGNQEPREDVDVDPDHSVH